jgi:transposase
MTVPCPYDLIVGLDRSDASADLHLLDLKSQRRWSRTLSTAPEDLHDWLAELRQQYPTSRVAVCLEQPAVNLILFLEAYSWITLHAINPLTLQKFREAFVTSRAKDDGKDARFLAELTASHWDKLPLWKPDEALTRRLRQLVVHRRSVVDERTALTNQLQDLLKHYFPQALRLCGEELWRPLATEFLRRWPSLPEAQKARPATIKAFYHLHGSRSPQLLEARLALLQNGVPLTEEAGLVETFALRVHLICGQLKLIRETVASYDEQIREVFAQHPDHGIFASFPGAGPVLAPRLLTAIGADRDRYQHAREIQRFTGIAPVTKQSGTKLHVHRRYRCPIFQRQSFHEYAKESVRHCRWAAAYYLQQREERAAPHHTAVRALAFKWQRVMFRCWKDHQPYDDARYEAQLTRRGSPLVKLFPRVDLGRTAEKSSTQNQPSNP